MYKLLVLVVEIISTLLVAVLPLLEPTPELLQFVKQDGVEALVIVFMMTGMRYLTKEIKQMLKI